MEPRFGHDFSHVRVHEGGEVAAMSRWLGADAFTYGPGIYFGRGRAPGISRLTAHELAHVVQQSSGAPSIMRETAVADRTEAGLDAAGQEASKAMEGQVAKSFVGVSNVRDVREAESLLSQVNLAKITLSVNASQPGWGTSITPDHVAENVATEAALSDFVQFAGEESRTINEFQERYTKVKGRFAKLEGMAQEYMAMNDVTVKSAEDIVSGETGLGAAKAGAQATGLMSDKKNVASVAATANKKRIRDLRTSNRNLATQLKDKDSDVSTKNLHVIASANKCESAANHKKVAAEEPDSPDVAAVKDRMKAVKSVLSEGVKQAKNVPQLKGIIETAEKVEETAGIVKKGLEAGGQKEAAEKVPSAEGLVDVILADIYKADMDKALTVQKIARGLSQSQAELAQATELQANTDAFVQSVTSRKEIADQLDGALQELRSEIRELGKNLDAAHAAKNPKSPGGGYKLVAQFLSEADVCITETDIALQAGAMEKNAREKAEARLKTVNRKENEKTKGTEDRVFHTAVKVAGRYELQSRRVLILSGGPGSSGGDQGASTAIDRMIDELKTGKTLIIKYQQTLNTALGI
jgi:hypothetical protein